MYDVVLFDLDHTLLDSDASHAAALDASLAPLSERTPVPLEQVRAMFTRLNDALWRGVERGEVNPNEVKTLRFVHLLDELGVAGDPQRMGEVFATTLTTHGELYPGARQLLDDVRETATLAMVTNGIGAVQRGRLARLGIEHHFDATVVSGEIGVAKPSSAIFDLVFDELDIDDRSASVMVGDNLGSDIAGGANAGIDTIWYNPHRAQNETAVEPTHEVASIGALSALLVPPV